MLCYWVTARKVPTPIGAMTDSHIRNCINMIAAGRPMSPNDRVFSRSEWIRIFSTELALRARKGTASG